MKCAAGLFSTIAHAASAARSLESAGYDKSCFGVIVREASDGLELSAEPSMFGEVRVVAIPGLGSVSLSGLLQSIIGASNNDTATSEVGGGIIESLTTSGITESQAEAVAEGVKRGGVLLLVRMEESQLEKVQSILASQDSLDLESLRKNWVTNGWEGFDATMDPGDHYPSL